MNRFSKRLWLGIILLGLAREGMPRLAAQSADAGAPIILGKSWKIPSKIFDESVGLNVYLPRDYDQGRDSYPVLISFQIGYPAVAGIVDGLADFVVPRMIAVSVDLDPIYVSLHEVANIPKSGQAEKVLRCLREEVIPFLDSRFRTRPFRMIAGSSWSALFGIYALFAAPDVFQAAFSAGPAFVGFDPVLISGILEKAIAARNPRNQYLFFTQGDQPELESALSGFQSLLKKEEGTGLQGLRWEFQRESGENHDSLPLKTLHDGLRSLFADWARLPESVILGGGEAIRARKKKIADFFGYDIGLSEIADIAVSQKWFGEKRYADLLGWAQYRCEVAPADGTRRASLAFILERLDRWRDAAEAYQAAITLIEADAGLPKARKAELVKMFSTRLAEAKKR